MSNRLQMSNVTNVRSLSHKSPCLNKSAICEHILIPRLNFASCCFSTNRRFALHVTVLLAVRPSLCYAYTHKPMILASWFHYDAAVHPVSNIPIVRPLATQPSKTVPGQRSGLSPPERSSGITGAVTGSIFQNLYPYTDDSRSDALCGLSVPQDVRSRLD